MGVAVDLNTDCARKCGDEADAFLRDCIRAGGDTVNCKNQASAVYALCLKRCQDEPPTSPPTNSLWYCVTSPQPKAERQCLNLTAAEVQTFIDAGWVIDSGPFDTDFSCQAGCGFDPPPGPPPPQPPPPPEAPPGDCRLQCRLAADAFLFQCIALGGNPVTCQNAALDLYYECLKGCDDGSGSEGACCLPNGTCVSATEYQCMGSGGVWAGPNTSCGTIRCDGSPPPGPPPSPWPPTDGGDCSQHAQGILQSHDSHGGTDKLGPGCNPIKVLVLVDIACVPAGASAPAGFGGNLDGGCPDVARGVEHYDDSHGGLDAVRPGLGQIKATIATCLDCSVGFFEVERTMFAFPPGTCLGPMRSEVLRCCEGFTHYVGYRVIEFPPGTVVRSSGPTKKIACCDGERPDCGATEQSSIESGTLFVLLPVTPGGAPFCDSRDPKSMSFPVKLFKDSHGRDDKIQPANYTPLRFFPLIGFGCGNTPCPSDQENTKWSVRYKDREIIAPCLSILCQEKLRLDTCCPCCEPPGGNWDGGGWGSGSGSGSGGGSGSGSGSGSEEPSGGGGLGAAKCPEAVHGVCKPTRVATECCELGRCQTPSLPQICILKGLTATVSAVLDIDMTQCASVIIPLNWDEVFKWWIGSGTLPCPDPCGSRQVTVKLYCDGCPPGEQWCVEFNGLRCCQSLFEEISCCPFHARICCWKDSCCVTGGMCIEGGTSICVDITE